MEKISRMLLLYSQLQKGRHINKLQYCLEYDCSPRAFDRDIEDIRLFLSEEFSLSELVYDRRSKEYYLTISDEPKMGVYDFLIAAQILISTSVLRQDELAELVRQMASHSEKTALCLDWASKRLSQNEDIPQPSLIKLHGDLQTCIAANQYLRLSYLPNEGEEQKISVFPCEIYMDAPNGLLTLRAFCCDLSEESPPQDYPLNRIKSFEIAGKVDESAKKRYEKWKYNMRTKENGHGEEN